MDSKIFLDILRRLEEQFGPMIGPFVASVVANTIKRLTTITYTEEQKQSFVENELKALEHRADDVRRANVGGEQ